MGDRVSVMVEIAGPFPATHLDALAQVCADDVWTLDWSDIATAETIREAVGDAPLTLCGSEVNYANTEELDAVLTAAGVIWRKSWDAGGGFGAGGELHDAQGVTEWPCDSMGGDALVGADVVRQLGSHEAVLAHLARCDGRLPGFTIAD